MDKNRIAKINELIKAYQETGRKSFFLSGIEIDESSELK